MDSVSQNFLNVFTIGSSVVSNGPSELPEMIRFVVVFNSLFSSVVGPDKSHPNLLLIATGPDCPRIISPPAMSQ